MPEDAASMGVVLVIGGTGVFGRLIVADLLTHTALSIAVASRHGVAPRDWLPGSEGRVTSHRLDACDEQALRSAIERTGACVVVHAAGPYALIGDAPLRAALGARIPYVDMCPRSDLFALLRDRYDAAARAAGLTCIVGASTAGGLTGLLTRRARERLRTIERVRSSLCVHNFTWGPGIVGDYLLSARRVLPHGRVGSVPERVNFPGLGRRTVRLADTLDYVDPAPDAVRDVAYRIGLPDALPELGLRLTLRVARLGVPLWRLARPLGACAGLLGGSYTEGGLLHQAFGEGAEGRGVLETHIHRAFGNVRNPSLLCALAADRLVRGAISMFGVIHPASWLAPSELIRALTARAVTVRTRFAPEGSPDGNHTQIPWENVE
jgi:NAD(P)-dependent dehydrogenase (short-subunit alcohol dehydrogenase family)